MQAGKEVAIQTEAAFQGILEASDFGETDIETPDSEVFAITKSEVGQSTLTNIEQLQSELQSLNDDVGEMSVEFEVLQKRENAKTLLLDATLSERPKLLKGDTQDINISCRMM